MGEAKGKQTHLGGEGMWNRAEERGTYDQNVLYGVLKELIKKMKRKTKKMVSNTLRRISNSDFLKADKNITPQNTCQHDN